MPRLGAVAVALILAAGFVAQSQEASHYKAIQQEYQSAEQRRASSDSPAPPVPKEESKSLEAASQKPSADTSEKSELDRQLVKYTGELARFTEWLVYATIVIAAIGVFQGWQLKRTVDLGREEFVATSNTSKYELRPYVGVENIFFTLEGAEERRGLVSYYAGSSILKLIVKNFGKTPAYSVKIFTLILSIATEKDATGTFRPSFDDPVFDGQVIYPDQSHTITFDQNEFPWMRFNFAGFLIYGKITYHDPLSRMDWTFEFCRQYIGGNEFTPYGTYNNETGISSQL